LFASLLAAVAWFASVEAAAAGGNVISPDGRTLTHLDMSVGITNITTGTVRNGTGFNSFSQFQVGTGNTVNLHVPDAANKLLNIVRDGPVFVDGILNGYKNGQIGGDIYFADPHGFVVGPNGTVNVGSLTVQTPKAEFLDSVIDAQGHIDDAATAALIAGATPVSADGFILVQGKINAQSGVHLSGQIVSVGGTTPPTTPAEISKMLFDATVNTAGLKEGAAITVRNGAILIEAAGDATPGGTVELSAAGTASFAGVTLDAGSDRGAAGSILIDPTKVVIGGTTTTDPVAN
jgi:filamentous hemagglutinin family protein